VGLGFFYPCSYFIITAQTVNLTDGIDGLAGTSAISVLALVFLRSSQEILFSLII
jgi:UDP-N-acetylmuramyl pentapeptide phosphotransferase/UDP-N-acetylglucosamine-1-phosphate transferase